MHVQYRYLHDDGPEKSREKQKSMARDECGVEGENDPLF